MTKQSFILVRVVIWMLFGVLIYSIWDQIVLTMNDLVPGQGGMVAIIAIVLAVLAILLVTSYIADVLEKGDEATKREKKSSLSRGQIKEQAERDAQAALKNRNPLGALQIYEQAEMLEHAADIARQLDDKPSLIRLFGKMGHHDRARRLSIELKDYEGAAQASALMNDIGLARELYKEAAVAREAEQVAPARLASLWDRAGDWLTAVSLYEQGGDFHSAAECHDLLEDPANARRCRDHAKVLDAFENRNKKLNPEEEAQLKSDLVNGGKLLESIGDFFGAGQTYRKAGLMMEAAIAFERFEEWERAARAYDECGMQDRAALSRSHIPPRPAKSPKVSDEMKAAAEAAVAAASQNLSFVYAGPPPARAPAPQTVAGATFQPLTQMQYIPVYSASVTVQDPEFETKLAQRLRRGNFREAAEFALAANNWLLSAALYEQAGDLLHAADLYKQIGKSTDAMFCLERAGRPRDAALLCLAVGENERAHRFLEQALDEKNDFDAGFMSANLLLRDGKKEEAIDLFRKRIARHPANEANAMLYYRFARTLEGQGDGPTACAFYKELLDAGADSPVIEARIKKLSSDSGYDKGVTAESATMIGSVLDEPSHGTAATSATVTGPLLESRSTPLRKFKLAINEDESGRAGDSLPIPGAPLARDMFSLFGAPGAPAKGDSVFEMDEDGDGSVPIPGVQTGVKAAVDPFASAQRYEIKNELARGGMGVVYEATDTALGRNVALKVIQRHDAPPEQYQQFLLEARAIARLTHPNIVTIYDIGLMDMKHYITMELVRGGTLEARVRKEQNGLSLREALRITAEIARGLETAHEAGIVHRDIKPNNILFTERGDVRIVDFGLAKLGDPAGKDSGGDSLFKMAGTPGYMAPEQIEGHESLPCCDIYALGITLFFMLVGKPPHETAGKVKMRQIAMYQLAGALPSLTDMRGDVPPAINEVFRYCTAVKQAERYQSISQFLSVVEHWHVHAD